MAAALHGVVRQPLAHFDSQSSLDSRIAVNQRVGNAGREQRAFGAITDHSVTNYIRVWKWLITYATRVAIYQTGAPKEATS